MSIREFTDRRGVRWKAWDVTPDHMHPVTRAEAFLADMHEGWLVFESDAARKRLVRFPSNWSDLPDEDLEDLLNSAQLAPRGRLSTYAIEEGEKQARSRAETHPRDPRPPNHEGPAP